MTNAVYKNALLTGMAERHSMPLSHVKAAVKEVLVIVKDGLLRDGSVRIHNFGTFRLKRIAEHQGRNPQTGETITIKAQNRVVFRPDKALRELIEPNKAKATPVVENTGAIKNVIADESLENKTERQPTAITQATPEITTISRPEIARKAIEAAQLNTEQGSVNEEDKQNVKPRNKIYALGAMAAVVVALLLVMLQNDKELIKQPAFDTQTITANETQSAPAVTVIPVALAEESVMTIEAVKEHNDLTEESIAIAETDKEYTVIETSPSTGTSASIATPLTQPNELHEVPFFSERIHQIMRGDSLWRLAENSYDEPLLWTYIYQANRNSIKNPDNLHINDELILPTLEGGPDELTERDRYYIAEGYYLAHLYYEATDNADSFYALLEAKRYSAKLVEEKMSSLNLTRLERVLLKR